MKTVTIYVRSTGHDADGDGLSPRTAYRSRERATMDIPVKFHPEQQYEIDAKGVFDAKGVIEARQGIIEGGGSVDVELAGLQTSTGDIWRLFRERGTGILWICKNALEYICAIESTLSDGRIVDGWTYSLAAEQLLKEWVTWNASVAKAVGEHQENEKREREDARHENEISNLMKLMKPDEEIN